MEELKQEILNMLCEEPLDIEKLLDKKTQYNKLCYENNVSSFIHEFDTVLSNYFILNMTPINYEIDEEEKRKAIDHFLDLKDGNIQGVSPEDVKIIMESVVNLVRFNLNQDNDIMTQNFTGFCGMGRELSYFPLVELGLTPTLNNAYNIPYSTTSHAFLTVSIPVLENKTVNIRQYLIDTTYQQFYTVDQNFIGSFFDGAQSFKNKCSPNAGYFVVNYEPNGKEFAENLIQHGYMELTEENTRLYFGGFSATGITLSTSSSENIKKITSISGSEYLRQLNNEEYVQDIDYDFEDLYEESDTLLLMQPTPNITDRKSGAPSI